ncbi:single-stranded-DNA-specific exonuclease RecJ [Pseudogemmobacter faecipullorum]|uniref:Single-stranded-DNA-specific exonuclease RecJ n=1 Tax=Pseudogemmobacter faecipullorum TaxID=2755041 RepID=A0ABS8CKH6_9RHOB|nr:single-stranded-DNA-specific exonuclease RecJ [Pseudogemmobacter faecipullorum]MCB5409892.1 single-stranded-DNA-specific exonuclease RecJ [Pseudogemmobacter faecipullorum]
MSNSAAFLGVEASLTGRRWVGPDDHHERLAEAMGQATRLPLPLCRLLAARGVAPDQAAAFLAPQLRDLLPDPRSLKDMEKAAARFLQALQRREKIAVFADYDVDGGASAALLLIWLREMGHAASLYIPDRIDEGYGPNIPAMERLAADHPLIICVDCGTLSHGPVAAAKPADVLILDHHLAAPELPAALAVVNPNRQDEDGSLAHLCAASVVFLMLVEANRQLRETGRRGPDLMAMLDLVALATVADVAPLLGVNRAFVRQGLKVMARRERIGLRALADIARMDQAPTAYALGFVLGPRINAGGRIGEADLGARLLACDDPRAAEDMAKRLDILNTARRDITEAVKLEAIAQAEARGLDGPLVWAAGEDWHPGVVGIVAARLKEATGRPAVVIGFDGGEGKGSGRSVPGIDLGAPIQRLAEEGLIAKGGGHKMAAGLSLSREQLEPAMARLGELLARQGAGESGPRDLRIDSIVMAEAAGLALIEQIEAAGPFGAAAPAPRFVIPSVAVSPRRVGESHLRLTIRAAGVSGLEAMAFGAFDGPLGPAFENAGQQLFHLAGRLEINSWGGRSKVQLRLDDAALAS